MYITTNEAAVLDLIKNGKASFFDAGWDVDSNTWTDVLTEDITRKLGLSAQAAGGVISSMIQKGLFYSNGEAVFLTEAAVAAL